MNPLLLELDRYFQTCSEGEVKLLLAEVTQRAISRLKTEGSITLTNAEERVVATVVPEKKKGKFKLTYEEFIAEGLRRARDPNAKFIPADEFIRMIEADCEANVDLKDQSSQNSTR